jgi:GNAT superfamily N-acetyltransferase
LPKGLTRFSVPLHLRPHDSAHTGRSTESALAGLGGGPAADRILLREQWKGRCAYRYSVESTVCLRPDAVGKGVGSRLYDALLAELRQLQFHTVIGGIALPNPASVALHEKFGFAKVVELGSLVRGQALVGVEVAVKCAPNNGGCEWNRTEDNTTVLSNVVERSGPLRP